MLFRDKREYPTLPLDGEAVSVRGNFNCVNGSASKPIYRVEYLERSNKIEFIHWRHDEHDDSPAQG